MYPRGRYNDALKHIFRRGGKLINIIDTNLSPFFSVEYSFCITVIFPTQQQQVFTAQAKIITCSLRRTRTVGDV